MDNTEYRQIVWLSSYPKSGNTWLRCFLDAYLTGEVNINQLLSSVTDDSAARALPGDGSDPSQYPVDIQMLTRPMSLLRLVRAFEANRLETGSQVPLFVKSHAAHVLVNGIELLPGALTKAVIYIVRDPRDVVISFAKHMGLELDQAIEFMGDKYRTLHDNRKKAMADHISSWEINVSSFVNADTHNVRVFKYEDMKAKPVETFSNILKHAGIFPERERVEKAIETAKLDRLRQQEAESGFSEASPHADKFFGQGSTGGWRDILKPYQVLRIEKKCAPMMKRLGYQFSSRSAA